MWVLRAAPRGLTELDPLQRRDADSQTFRITDGSIKTIGRATRADFIVDAPLVSRVHCRVTADISGQLVVEDLDSTNGTRLNGTRITRGIAKNGDEIGLGEVTILVERHER